MRKFCYTILAELRAGGDQSEAWIQQYKVTRWLAAANHSSVYSCYGLILDNNWLQNLCTFLSNYIFCTIEWFDICCLQPVRHCDPAQPAQCFGRPCHFSHFSSKRKVLRKFWPKTREKGVVKEDLANEISCIGWKWPLRGSVAFFHKICLPSKLSDVWEWSQWDGFDFVDLKCAEKNCGFAPRLAFAP